MEERFQYITYKGQSIILLDLYNLQDDREIVRLLKLLSNPEKPHRVLVDVTSTHFDWEIMKEAKENAKAIPPLIKAFAVIGTGSMVSLLVSAVSRFSGMNIAMFGDRQEAMDWVAKELAKH